MTVTYSKFQKVRRFLFYTVVLSIVPFFAAAIYDWYIGYDFCLFKSEYTPDFVLITFAIAASVCGSATDEEKFCESNAKWTKRSTRVAIATMFICLFFYALLLNTGDFALRTEEVVKNRAMILAIASGILLLPNVVLGSVIS